MFYQVDITDVYTEKFDTATGKVMPDTRESLDAITENAEQLEVIGHTICDALKTLAKVMDIEFDQLKERMYEMSAEDNVFAAHAEYSFPGDKIGDRRTYEFSVSECTTMDINDVKNNWGEDEDNKSS